MAHPLVRSSRQGSSATLRDSTRPDGTSRRWFRTLRDVLDAHCHLDDPRFDGDRDAVMDRARAAGITGLVVPGVAPERWRRLPGLRARFPEVQVGYGLHPEALERLSGGVIREALAELPQRLVYDGAVCVGETGLDRRSPVPLAEQVALTRAHLAIAGSLDLPVVLHCVRAHGTLLETLEAHGPLRGLVHGYSGPAELVPRYLALGLHLSFGGPVTWPGAKRPRAALLAVPDDRLLLETDAPDQPPASRRGGRNEPALLAEIARAVAGIRGRPVSADGAGLGWGNARARSGSGSTDPS